MHTCVHDSVCHLAHGVLRATHPRSSHASKSKTHRSGKSAGHHCWRRCSQARDVVQADLRCAGKTSAVAWHTAEQLVQELVSRKACRPVATRERCDVTLRTGVSHGQQKQKAKYTFENQLANLGRFTGSLHPAKPGHGQVPPQALHVCAGLECVSRINTLRSNPQAT